jgi:hypothetical protein
MNAVIAALKSPSLDDLRTVQHPCIVKGGDILIREYCTSPAVPSDHEMDCIMAALTTKESRVTF